ncbi:16S rRNA (guanine(966)-N(2))-methyltransferase RsmD [Caldichromatium japonicum]|uniref:Ribosomal RNA small subunit methyltransferase D n=1 Tax=Caldichromatium japonicum TaxID=2699430 RepID=A0A6G7VAM4_9GAMM|nr:16S rRNA (guanine(966)-N(2))-methyltransferase RsmD [Caldichromatium japonicum]QIK36916.1 16S rRNA (guanine(966)-N(2))-methyltransferase RsmD [Caldichromatium japonicum]
MTRPANELRLIGGRHRGRRLPFPNHPGLRPTPDRVRETLFNWLAPVIQGARCLDLFAGSGALGFEALSRGAAQVIMVENAPLVVCQLRANAARLGESNLQIDQADALRWLEREAQVFDLVFLDPPYTSGLLVPAIDWLVHRGWLAVGAYLYLEAGARDGLPPLPDCLELIRDQRAGQVRYGLARVRDEV